MAKMDLKCFPEDMSALPVDPTDLGRTLVDGCFKQSVEVQGQKREFITYIPEKTASCSPCLVVAPPSGEDGLEYIERSGLKEFADEKKLFLFVMIPENAAWNLSGADADFMNAVYVEAQARDYYVTMQDNFYACGIGDGADVAQQAACRMSSEWSGLMTMGDLQTSLEEITLNKEAAGMGDGELQIAAERTQLPVWMVVSRWEGASVSAASWWRANNRSGEEVFSTKDADYIWMPAPIRQTLEMDEEMIAQVRVTVGDTACSLARLEQMWSYIGLARRHRGQERKNLRYFKDPLLCGAVRKTMEVDGLTREWYEYVPKCCTPDQKWPVVVVMHGRGGTAETFFDISNMYQVANRRKFIVACPQAGVYQQKKGGLRNVASWSGSLDGKSIDDIRFSRTMLEDMEKRLPVDKGRIYACGQSSGGMMADTLCEFAGELFAATVSWSGLYTPARSTVRGERSLDAPPSAMIFGEKDRLTAGTAQIPDVPFTISETFKDMIEEKFRRYQLDKSRVQIWRDDPITWYCYPDSQGVPMFTVGIVDHMVHANYPEESWISYDQFFCNFCRDEDGKVCYRGRRIGENN